MAIEIVGKEEMRGFVGDTLTLWGTLSSSAAPTDIVIVGRLAANNDAQGVAEVTYGGVNVPILDQQEYGTGTIQCLLCALHAPPSGAQDIYIRLSPGYGDARFFGYALAFTGSNNVGAYTFLYDASIATNETISTTLTYQQADSLLMCYLYATRFGWASLDTYYDSHIYDLYAYLGTQTPPDDGTMGWLHTGAITTPAAIYIFEMLQAPPIRKKIPFARVR